MALEDEFVKQARTSEFGSYTQSEAKQLWQTMLQSSDVYQDKGPRGLVRCEVEVGAFGEKFAQFSHARSARAEISKLKKATADDFQQQLGRLSMSHSQFGGVEVGPMLQALKTSNVHTAG